MRSFSKRGFSIVEIMIAVAIIGILAAVAVPNDIKFQKKSRQSEACCRREGGDFDNSKCRCGTG